MYLNFRNAVTYLRWTKRQWFSVIPVSAFLVKRLSLYSCTLSPMSRFQDSFCLPATEARKHLYHFMHFLILIWNFILGFLYFKNTVKTFILLHCIVTPVILILKRFGSLCSTASTVVSVVFIGFGKICLIFFSLAMTSGWIEPWDNHRTFFSSFSSSPKNDELPRCRRCLELG